MLWNALGHPGEFIAIRPAPPMAYDRTVPTLAIVSTNTGHALVMNLASQSPRSILVNHPMADYVALVLMRNGCDERVALRSRSNSGTLQTGKLAPGSDRGPGNEEFAFTPGQPGN